MEAPRVEVDLLGPLRVRVDGVETDVGGARPRSLVAALALCTGDPVTTEHVAAAVWGDDPPPSAEATLRVYVSRLRKSLGDALRRERGGIVLDAVVDAEAFRSDLEQRRDEPDHLAAALGRWRGPALVGVAATPLLQRAASRLEALRQQALQRHAEALLAVGRAEDAVAALTPLLVADPAQEALVGLQMRALYRCGRQHEALAAYRALRAALQDASGLEPSPGLQALHEAVLAQDPSMLGGGHEAPPAPPAPAGATPDGVPAPAPVRSGPTTNLPLPLTSFVGRADELTELAGLLEDHRLLTLTGPGGTGKTRLALELCRRRSDEDGPWLLELAAVEDPDLVPNVVAQTLGVTASDDRTPLEVLVGALRDRRTVVLLDNCEHVLDSTAVLVERVLTACPHIRVVATSREPLGVPGERIVPVAPLPVVRRSPQLIAVDGDAMRLFSERARQVVDLPEDPATTEAVRRICRDLDGLPLAIELAAAELRVLSPAELADQLADRFALLTSGPRTALPRQRTLQEAVAWSVDLLDDRQREVFAQLSVFVGGFELDAVKAVCGPAAAPVLPSLVDKSLVEVDTTRQPRRHRLLETLRQYGDALLDDATRTELRARHAAWAAELAGQACALQRGPDGVAWERRLDREAGNLRTALRTSLDAGDRPTALRLAANLWWWWYRRARVDEGRRWLEEIVVEGLEPSRDLAQAQKGQAYLAFFAADPAIEAYDEASIRTAAEVGDEATAALAIAYRGYRHGIDGDLASARRNLDEGLARMPADAPGWMAVELDFIRGQVARVLGDHDAAGRHLTAAVEGARAAGHRWALGVATWVLGEHELDLDHPVQAARWFREALTVAREDEDRGTLIAVLQTIAGTAARLGRPTDGARILGAVGTLAGRVGIDTERLKPADSDRVGLALRRALRPEALQQAIAEGAALPLPRVIALADAVCAGAAEVA
jgi:predicted ATPase/DNA-binding SARP family transcriptional activator